MVHVEELSGAELLLIFSRLMEEEKGQKENETNLKGSPLLSGDGWCIIAPALRLIG